jgi:hypothetical protein
LRPKLAQVNDSGGYNERGDVRGKNYTEFDEIFHGFARRRGCGETRVSVLRTARMAVTQRLCCY